jgi:hypothetical protein
MQNGQHINWFLDAVRSAIQIYCAFPSVVVNSVWVVTDYQLKITDLRIGYKTSEMGLSMGRLSLILNFVKYKIYLGQIP